MAVISVNSAASLNSALKSASAGDVIQLSAGSYSGLALNNVSFGSGITITSADPSHAAILTDFSMKNVQGVTFSNVTLTATEQLQTVAADTGYWAFKVSKSSDIHFDHVSVHGSLDGNALNDVYGIQIRDSSNVSVTNSEFQQLGRALAIGQSQDVVVNGNSAHDLRSDGFDFAEVARIKVTNNSFHDFKPANGDHPDAIQFWTSGTKTPSHDILISGNVISRGEGEYTQGIFLRDQIGTLHYQNVTIADNLIIGTGYSGIRVQGATGLNLTNNNLVSFTGDNKTFLLIQNSDNVTATNNHGAQISFDSTVTHLTQTGTVITAAVSDHGAAALQQWATTNSAAAPVVMDSVQAALTTSKVAATATAAVVADPHPGAEVLNGSVKDDMLQGHDGNDTLVGNGGNDTLAGGAGDDVYVNPTATSQIVETAGGGTDTVIARSHYTLTSNVENLVIDPTDTRGWRGTGNELNNVITGNVAANQLSGLAGNDTIDGGGGNDTLIGGAGNDSLIGGAGDDVFRFEVGGGKDVIGDYGAGHDTIDIYAYYKAGLAPTVTDVGADTVISFSNGDSITVLHTHAAELGTYSKMGWII